MIFYNYIKKINSSKHQYKAEFKNLDDSEVLSSDFFGLRTGYTGPFLLNKSSKIQIFTDILYPFCQRLLRPADVTFLKTKNVCISKIYHLSILKLLSNKILLAYFYLPEPIHKVQFNVRYPVCIADPTPSSCIPKYVIQPVYLSKKEEA